MPPLFQFTYLNGLNILMLLVVLVWAAKVWSERN